MDPETEAPNDAWFDLHSSDLLQLLERARAGESPELLVIELWANCGDEDEAPEAGA